MEKVLLAIDGMTPEQNAFRYALALCKRIKAELGIFQIIRPQHYRKYKNTIRNKATLAKKFFEGSMMAATFAEAGEHETALEMLSEASEEIRHLLKESENAGIPCHFSIKTGTPDKEIIKYVNDHRNVVLAIYDFSDPDGNERENIRTKTAALANIKKRLPVPLVTVQG